MLQRCRTSLKVLVSENLTNTYFIDFFNHRGDRLSFWSLMEKWCGLPPLRLTDVVCSEHRERDAPLVQHGMLCYAISRVTDIKSVFELFVTEHIEKIVLEQTNREGRRVYGGSWSEMGRTDLQAFLSVLILGGVFRSCKEAAASLWSAHFGRANFRATLPLKTFYRTCRVIRFDDRGTREARHRNDKLGAIRDVWENWVYRLQLLYNPGADVAVDERLVPFRGRCGFKQYIPQKPGKYSQKI
ncbi:hypothetical protein ABVT39_011368 [Epinephelus coioides]